MAGLWRLGTSLSLISVRQSPAGAVDWQEREFDASLRPHPSSPERHYTLISYSSAEAVFESRGATGHSRMQKIRICFSRRDGELLTVRFQVPDEGGGWLTARESVHYSRRAAADSVAAPRSGYLGDGRVVSTEIWRMQPLDGPRCGARRTPPGKRAASEFVVFRAFRRALRASMLAALAGAAACQVGDDPPPSRPLVRYEEALRHRITAAELLPQIDPEPTLVASVIASTGQQIAMYEYHPAPPGVDTVQHVTLIFANDTLESAGTDERTRQIPRFLRWLDRDPLDDHHTPERQRKCTEALRRSAFTRTATFSHSSIAGC